MNQQKEKGRLSPVVLWGLVLGSICAVIVGWIFQFIDRLKYIASMGGPDELIDAAFITGALVGGLLGGLIGGAIGESRSKTKK